MSTRYPYVGPERIRLAALEQPEGTSMLSHDDLARWARYRTTGELRAPFTYVVDVDDWLRLAPRESEHVARAGGHEVLGAGELVLARVAGRWSVVDITNQSTGYCPDAASWTAVAAALDRAGIARPARFTIELLLRQHSTAQAIPIPHASEGTREHRNHRTNSSSPQRTWTQPPEETRRLARDRLA